MPKKSIKPEENNQVLELTADLQRLQADFINFKARAEREKSDSVAYGRQTAVEELLPVFDNLERAFAHCPDELRENTWVKGINGLEKQLEGVLANLGLTKIVALGQEFDPNIMEAVSAEGEGEKEIVSEELQSGYVLDGKVLRPVMVRVTRQ